MDKEPPSRTGHCGSINCTDTGTNVFKFYHATKHPNRETFYCMTCVQKIKDLGRGRTKKYRTKRKTKNVINTVPDILQEVCCVPLPTICPRFQKLNVPEKPSTLFHMDKP